MSTLRLLFGASVFTCLFLVASVAGAATLSRPANNLGLVGYWAFDEGTSTNASDFSGRGNTGTLTNALWTSGKHGAALSYDGSGDYVNISSFTALNGATAITVCAWVYLNTIGTTNDTEDGGIFNKSLAGGNDENLLLWYNVNAAGTGDQVYTFDAGNSSTASNRINGLTKARVGVWQHVCGVMSGTNRELYLNGVSDNSSTGAALGTYTGGSNDVRIGGWTGGAGFDFDGKIDDVRVYRRALTATQIAALYKAGEVRRSSSQGSTVTNGLVGRWTFDGKDVNWTSATAGSAYDTSGSGNHGTLTSMTRSVSQTIGKLGQAFVFDGVNDYVNLGSTGLPTGASAPWTIALWAKPSLLNSAVHMITAYGDGATNGASPHIALTTANQWRVSCWGAANDKDVTSPTPVVGQWDHIVGTYDGTNIRIYVNGTLVTGPSSASCTPVSTRARIGASPRSSVDQFYGGSIDDVRIYNRAITAAEAKTIYNEGAGVHANTSSATLGGNGTLNQGLVGYWTFDGPDVTTVIADKSGTGNSGYVFNAATSSKITIGKLGQGLRFGGSTDLVSMVNPSGLPAINAAQTMAVWYWVASNPGTSVAMVTLRTTADSAANQFTFNSGNLRVSKWGGTALHSITAPAAGVWHHLAWTTDGSTGIFYVDGAQVDTDPVTLQSGSVGRIYLSTYNGVSEGFTGKLDDLRIYDRSLSAAEVKALYNMGR